jgi:spoIIIJ-associated protein
LDGLAEAFGIESSTTVETEGDEIEVKLDGADVGMLIGQRGATLLAIQDLTRVVAQRRLGDHETRLRIDIGGYRERRRAALSRFTMEQAEAVKTSGKARVPSADRKVIHDTIAGIDGVSSRSEGDDPHRRVVIVPETAAT